MGRLMNRCSAGERGTFKAGRRIPAARLLRTQSCLLLLCLAASLSGCDLFKESPETEAGVRRIVPRVYDEQAHGSEKLAGMNTESLEQTPKVPLDDREKLIRVINTNLDLDTNDEQILVLRQKDDPNSPLKIAVIDYDPVRETYSRTWESLTNATNLRLLDISLKDVVGDHNLEIVCRGMNEKAELTLDLFRKTPSPAGLGLYFTEILRIVADGSIDIDEIERSEGYLLGQKNGPSFVIYAYSRDLESENVLDRVKRTYYWQYQQNRYVLTGVEKLPGTVVEEEQLEELFADPSVEAFEAFLAGPWYLADADGKEEILLFLPEQRRITIYAGDVQEVYIWQASFRSLSNRLLAFGANESIESIIRRFNIEVVSLNTIDVSILGAEQWDRSSGRYLKLTDELQQDLLSKERTRIRPAKTELKGLYQSGAGFEIIFEPPRFTWIEDGGGFSGGFTVIHLDREVLYLQGMDDDGLPTKTATYIMEYAENQENNYMYRTLTLVPGKLNVHGVEPTSEKRIVFEQLEILEDEREAEAPQGQ
jgi:hypothetical protein